MARPAFPIPIGKQYAGGDVGTLIFLAALLCLCMGKPRLRYSVPMDGSYMSHERTMAINGLFLVLIVLKHSCIIGYNPEGSDEILQDNLLFPLRQLVVATFFFYSGYGIMHSILRKGGTYLRDLLRVRFLRLYLNFAVAGLISFAIMATFRISPMVAAKEYLLSMVGMGGWWFIVMTLALYLLTWVSFRLCGLARPRCAVAMLFALTLILCLALLPCKPSWWIDTEPCFAAGAAYCMLQPRIDRALGATHLPISLIGAAAIALTMLGINHLPTCNYYLSLALQAAPDAGSTFKSLILTHVHAILFAMGVSWLFAGITWQRVPAFLKWFGGRAVFVVFLWHYIPLHLFCHLGLNTAHPHLYVLLVFLTTLLLARLGIRLFNRLDKVFQR